MGAEIDGYRREALERAAACREQAALTDNLLLQRTWLRLAEQYEQLAAAAEEERQPKRSCR